MAKITLKGNPVNTSGNLPAVGSTAPNFTLTREDLSDVSLQDYAGKKKVLNIFPSIDTPVCATSVRTFNQQAAELPNVAILNISSDLPFAHKRFCGSEGIKNTESLSSFRSQFAKEYGLQIVDGKLSGLCSRAIVVIDENNNVLHVEQVSEIASEPNYADAINALRK